MNCYLIKIIFFLLLGTGCPKGQPSFNKINQGTFLRLHLKNCHKNNALFYEYSTYVFLRPLYAYYSPYYAVFQPNNSSIFVIEIKNNSCKTLNNFNNNFNNYFLNISFIKLWQNRGLYIFYLPSYSPHLNIIERLWKEMRRA